MYAFLCRASSWYNPFQFGNVELVGVCLHHAFPTTDAHYFYGVYQRVFLETFKCIYQYRFVIYVYELLGDVLPHSVARASGYY